MMAYVVHVSILTLQGDLRWWWWYRKWHFDFLSIKNWTDTEHIHDDLMFFYTFGF